MQFENRLPDNDVNITRVNPLKQFFQLVIGALVLVVTLVILLQVSGGWLAKRVPFGFELAVMSELDLELGHSDKYPDMAAYLNQLAIRIAEKMPLQNTMQISVHYNEQDIFNAYATLGGNLMFYKGLLENMPDENTLAMVMAHEIAHVLHRDPVASLGGGVASTLAVLAVTGRFGSDMAGSLLGGAGTVTGLSFTRGMELKADQAALDAINELYGHVGGATALFDMFSDERGPSGKSTQMLEQFLSTHPRDAERVDAVSDIAKKKGWKLQGEMTKLPEDFERWL